MTTLKIWVFCLFFFASCLAFPQTKPDTVHFKPFIWMSEPPQNCPFIQSKELTGIKFLGIKSGFHVGDTWYPSWADDDKLYSPFTDGDCPRLDGSRDLSISDGNVPQGYGVERTSTGQAVIEGDDRVSLKLYSLGLGTNDFKHIKPLMEWNNNMGCVTVTYNAPLKKYMMCVTDGGNTSSRMNSYILESKDITGEWKLISYMKNFGEQAYFLNIPSKFISADGELTWLLYSGNFATDWNGMQIQTNPPGSHYGLILHKIEFLR